MNTILCKKCLKHRPVEGCKLIEDEHGRLKARCATCVEGIKKAKQ